MAYRLRKPHRRRGTLYQAGEMYRPTSAELRAFPDVFESVDDEEGTDEEESVDEASVDIPMQGKKSEEPKPVAYHIAHRGGGWYDVVLPDGTPQNETALREPEAEELYARLQRRRTRG